MSRKISIVVPVYYNEANLPHTIPKLLSVLGSWSGYEFELIFVDDGSGDNSSEIILDHRRRDNRIKLVMLSRNFGSMNAILAGISIASGDCVGVISADLQDPPELFEDMVRRWEAGDKVVMAVRKDREESFGQRVFSHSYYFLLDKFALRGYPRGGFDFVLLDRRVAQELTRIREKNTNIMSLIYWLGFRRSSVEYVRRQREHGVSRWTVSKKVKLFVDSFVSFSYIPIRSMSVIGLVTACVSVCYGIWEIFSRIFLHTIVVAGWTTLIVVLTFLLGAIMVMLGIIGEYLWRILDESRNRPGFVIDETYD